MRFPTTWGSPFTSRLHLDHTEIVRMFRTAELGRSIEKSEFKRRVPALREGLLSAQNALRGTDSPVIVLFGGVDGAGKGDVVNSLNEWMDPRWLVTRAFDEPSDEEKERPEYWRFWRALPPKGQVGLLMSAWYSRPLIERAHGGSEEDFERALENIVGLEQQLADDGACIIKFWLHLGKQGQEKRFRRLESDPVQAWRVNESDWANWERYDDFIGAAERIIGRTSTGAAQWHIVEGHDLRYASLHVGEMLLETMQSRIAERERLEAARANTPPTPGEADTAAPSEPARDEHPVVATGSAAPTILSALDTTQRLEKSEYNRLLPLYQGRVNQLQKQARDRGISTLLVFEGWDAAGKGGAIRRINAALDSRAVRVIPVAAPTDEEQAHHYLWRFWRHLSRAGQVTIFDRSWYGRVLVERVEGFATQKEWLRAYGEINRFEQQLTDHGIVLLKFWMHISQDEQLRRFEEREQTPYKRWKLTGEDWRNRARWAEYEEAVHDMVERTSSSVAPWRLIGADDKRLARISVLRQVCEALARSLGEDVGVDEAQKEVGNGKKRKNGKDRKASRAGMNGKGSAAA
jgi:polyphosphate:AMP phosphotransferase